MKHFIPLESDPVVFTSLIHDIGAPKSLVFREVISLDAQDLPSSAIAYILVLPTSEAYEARTATEDESREVYQGQGKDEAVVWFKQTINNACGLYGILHALSNGEARHLLDSNSLLARIFESCEPLLPTDRSLVIENQEELEEAYRRAAVRGSSKVPDNPEDEVDYHYVCFVRSRKNGRLYELDGDRKGPIELSVNELDAIRRHMDFDPENISFSLLALCSEGGSFQS